MPTARKKNGSTGRSRSGRSSKARSSAKGKRAQARRRTAAGADSKVKYSKWIESPDDHEERQGQSLATRNHDVIRQWAEARKAAPATAGDTQRGKGIGVLRMDFQGYGGKRLKKVSWDAWFETFDGNKLVFLFQEHKADGSPSNFFRLNRLR
jgi:hypothetical protein